MSEVSAAALRPADSSDLSRTPVLLLAGGRGTRVSHLHPDIPKPMFPVAGLPFLEWVIRYFVAQGFGRFAVSVGHLGDAIEHYLAERSDRGATSFRLVREREPAGTGGAVALAREALEGSDSFVVANADSLLLADMRPAIELLSAAAVDAVVLGIPMADASRYGSLELADGGHLRAFREKVPGRGLVNSGIYLFKKRALAGFPARYPLSLERDALPTLLKEGARIVVSICDAPFLDIGTPETLGAAEDFVTRFFPAGGQA